MSFRVIDPQKLKDKRGEVSMDQIIERANKAFSKPSLSAWETGKWKPRDDQIPHLLKALGAEWEEISSPVGEIAVA